MEELLRNPQKIKLISQFLPHYNATAKPLDLFISGKQPSIFQLPVIRSFESWHIIGIFNWDDKYENFNIPLEQFAPDSEWHAFEFFEEKYLGNFKSEIPVNNIVAHGCRLLAVRKKTDVPQLLGTNMHLYQGAVDIDDVSWGNDELRIKISHFSQNEKSTYIYYPDNYCLKNIETDAKDFIVDDRKNNLLKIQFNGNKRTFFSMKFS